MIPFLKSAFFRLPRAVRGPLQQLWRRLPPRDQRFLLHNLDDESRRRAFLHSPEYQAFARQEMNYWGASQQSEVSQSENAHEQGETSSATLSPGAPATFRYFAEHPLVLRELQRRACPDTGDEWSWMQARYAGREHGLVLGAGGGNHCRLLIDCGITRRVTAFDLAEDSVALAQREFRRVHYSIDYQTADLNFAPLDGQHFDFCLAMHIFHHVIDLESLIARLAQALAGGAGILVGEDYVGPRFIEYPAASRKAAQALFATLPERLRRTPDGQSVLRRLDFEDRWILQRRAPFEAIRSDRITDLLQRHFQMDYQAPLGGGLLLILLNAIIHNFDPAVEEDNTWLERILVEDLRLSQTGAIPNGFLFFAARPK